MRINNTLYYMLIFKANNLNLTKNYLFSVYLFKDVDTILVVTNANAFKVMSFLLRKKILLILMAK